LNPQLTKEPSLKNLKDLKLQINQNHQELNLQQANVLKQVVLKVQVTREITAEIVIELSEMKNCEFKMRLSDFHL
jgi:hypothetical protein